MKTFFFRTVLDFPRATLLFVAIMVGFAVFYLKDFYLDASADSLVLENDQSLAYYRKIAQRYETDEFLFITYRPMVDLFSEENIQTIWQMRDELAKVDGVNSVVSMLDVPLFSGTEGSMADKVRNAKTLRDPAMDRARAREEFISSPIYRDLLISGDGQTTAIQVNLVRDERYYEMLYRRNALREKKYAGTISEEETQELEELANAFRVYNNEAADRRAKLIQDVRELMDGYRQHGELFLGGVPMIASDMIAFIRSDLKTFGMAMLIFLAGTLLVIFRKLRWMAWPLFSAALVVVLMFGFLGFMKWPVTVISSNFVSLLLILCVSFTIHIIVRYQDVQADNPEADQRTIVQEAVETISVPCLYSALTTLVAFMSLLVSGIRPVIDFGMMMAMGITVAFVLVFLVLPAGHMLMNKTAPVSASARASQSTAFFARITETHGGKIVLAALVLLGFCVAGILQLKVENRFIDYFRSSTEIYQGMIVIDEQLGGTTPLDIIIDTKPGGPEDPVAPAADAGPAADPFLDDAAADADAGWDDPFLEGGGAADYGQPAEAWDDPFLDEGAAGGAPGGAEAGWDDPFLEPGGDGQAVVPEAQPLEWFSLVGLQRLEEVHDYLEARPESGKVMSLALLPKLIRELNGGRMLNEVELAFLRALMPEEVRNTLVAPFLSADGSQVRINVRVMETDKSLQRQKMLTEVRRDLTGEMGFADEDVKLTGVLVLYNNMLQSLFRSQILTLGFVFFAIMGMFFVLFRSLYVALIAIFPNMLAAGSVLGIMGWAGIPLDMMSITIAAITVGIAVDNTIHYVHRFRREFPVDRNYLQTMYRCHASIGRAMYYVSITIIVGFSILVLSNFIPTVYFGLFTALAMMVALLFSLTLLPRLLVTLKPLGPEQPVANPNPGPGDATADGGAAMVDGSPQARSKD